MQRIAAALVLALALALPSLAGAEPKPIEKQQFIGKWMVGAYTDDTARSFTHCSSTLPTSPTDVVLTINIAYNGERTLSFDGPEWSLIPRALYPFELLIDGVSLGILRAQAFSPKQLGAPLPDDDAVLVQPMLGLALRPGARKKSTGMPPPSGIPHEP